MSHLTYCNLMEYQQKKECPRRQVMANTTRGVPKDECAKSTVRMPFGIPRMAFAMIHTVDLAYSPKCAWR